MQDARNVNIALFPAHFEMSLAEIDKKTEACIQECKGRKSKMAVRLVLDAKNIVGETLIWPPDEQALYWVDICAKRIHRLDPRGGRHDSWLTPEFPTSIG